MWGENTGNSGVGDKNLKDSGVGEGSAKDCEAEWEIEYGRQ